MDNFERPKMDVLPAESLIPPENLVKPPEMMTHRVPKEAPYSFAPGAPTAGSIPAGAEVFLESKSDGHAWIVNPNGLRVLIDFNDLRPLA